MKIMRGEPHNSDDVPRLAEVFSAGRFVSPLGGEVVLCHSLFLQNEKHIPQ